MLKTKTVLEQINLFTCLFKFEKTFFFSLKVFFGVNKRVSKSRDSLEEVKK